MRRLDPELAAIYAPSENLSLAETAERMKAWSPKMKAIIEGGYYEKPDWAKERDGEL